ncbi:hypothetical protein DMB38_12955 [Streptomyces sp. WAC 06738]|uniref:hypothetical protein n=1 Tax=Streptomyces sp. WAC 06738 TaxID=2203210 RepID=UPI000F6EB739|nr:hypothetical protein [Streptomyces sp. WAC 06738]AZM46603.1 hypothetical protein DMB38_12955 [Streptomyces sp. WAC 06738]
MTTRQAGDGARRGTCGCGAPLLRQLVGRVAALSVVADARPLPLARALAAVEPNRLAWCLINGEHVEPRLRWINRGTHPATCPHAHVLDHRCNGPPRGRRP